MSTLSEILTSIGTIASALIGQVAQWVGVLNGNPILVFVVLLAFATIGIGLLSRLYRSFR